MKENGRDEGGGVSDSWDVLVVVWLLVLEVLRVEVW